jgi:hypothetical protein
LLLLGNIYCKRRDGQRIAAGSEAVLNSPRGCLAAREVEFLGIEGLAVAIGLVLLPVAILWLLVKLLPPWQDAAPVMAR